MEKFLNPYDREFVRMAMLKHEETFKEQVHELHRLYQIQRILMMNSKNMNFAQNSLMKLDMERAADNQEFPAESTTGDQESAMEIIDESEIELTLGPSSSSYKTSKKKQPETPLTSASSFSSSSTGSTNIDRTTRSCLHHHQNMMKNTKRSEESSGGFELGIVNFPDMTLGSYQSENKTSSSGVDVDQQLSLNQPPWILQVLSLNMA